MTQKDYKIKVLEKALDYAVKGSEKEGCYYCPIGCSKSVCKLEEDSEQCHNFLKETFIRWSKEDMKRVK